jgi:hypothetical protein
MIDDTSGKGDDEERRRLISFMNKSKHEKSKYEQ